MTTITITLPDDLAKRAEEKGLLSQTAIESYVRDRLQETDVFEALMRFGDGRRLGGLSIREMAAEGRRWLEEMT